MGFSKPGLLGPIFGSTMLALINSSDAEAASPRCDNVDLSRAPDIKAALTLCLKGEDQPADLKLLDTPREIAPARCDKERNRAINMFETVCRFDIPADKACPADVDRKSRVGNRFDPKYLANDRSVGTTSCRYDNLVPPTLKR